MAKPKQEVITFKVDAATAEVMKTITNRSEFIRAAIQAALDNACPLCKGTGVLTQSQKKHWDKFAQDHVFNECKTCHEWHLVCRNSTEETDEP